MGRRFVVRMSAGRSGTAALSQCLGNDESAGSTATRSRQSLNFWRCWSFLVALCQSVRAMPSTTWPSCAVWLSTSYAGRKVPKSIWLPNVNEPVGKLTISSKFSPKRMRIPCQDSCVAPVARCAILHVQDRRFFFRWFWGAEGETRAQWGNTDQTDASATNRN